MDNQRRAEEEIKKRGYRVNPKDAPTKGRPSNNPTDLRGGQGKTGKCPGSKAPPGTQWSLLFDFWPWITPEMVEQVMGTIES